MIEITTQAGVRRFHGDELTKLESEPLAAMQGFIASAGPCIVAGCATTPNGSNYDIAPGLVGIDHADGFKIARFAGVTNVSLPGHLYIDKAVTTKLYDDGLNHPAVSDYTAVFQPGVIPPLVPYLSFPTTGATPFLMALILQGTFGVASGGGVLAGGALNYTAIANFNLRSVNVVGSIVVTSGVSDPPLQYALFTLPVGSRPILDHHYTASVRYHSAFPPLDTGGQNIIVLSGSISSSSGVVTLGLRRPLTGSYTANFNIIVPLW